jgi:hypothetical protein
MRSYYEGELKRLIDGGYNKSIKIFDGEGNHTKQLDITEDSIAVLIEFLKNEKKKLKLKAGAK